MVEQRYIGLENKVKLAHQRIKRSAFKLIVRPDFEEIMEMIGDANYYTRVHTDKYWIDSLSELGIDPIDAWNLVERRRLVNRDELDLAIANSRDDPTSSGT